MKQVTTDGSAQWQAWGDFGENGNLYVAYYDRENNCESTGCNDITLAKSTNLGTSWTFQRMTTGSMPNLTPANNAVQAGFLGDYMWTQVANGQVYVCGPILEAWWGHRPRFRRRTSIWRTSPSSANTLGRQGGAPSSGGPSLGPFSPRRRVRSAGAASRGPARTPRRAAGGRRAR
jgi:hypothetical protein